MFSPKCEKSWNVFISDVLLSLHLCTPAVTARWRSRRSITPTALWTGHRPGSRTARTNTKRSCRWTTTASATGSQVNTHLGHKGRPLTFTKACANWQMFFLNHNLMKEGLIRTAAARNDVRNLCSHAPWQQLTAFKLAAKTENAKNSDFLKHNGGRHEDS